MQFDDIFPAISANEHSFFNLAIECLVSQSRYLKKIRHVSSNQPHKNWRRRKIQRLKTTFKKLSKLHSHTQKILIFLNKLEKQTQPPPNPKKQEACSSPSPSPSISPSNNQINYNKMVDQSNNSGIDFNSYSAFSQDEDEGCMCLEGEICIRHLVGIDKRKGKFGH